MIIETTKRGLAAARANWKLIATLWLINALLALTAALPGWLALSDAIGNLPLADALARSFSFGVLSDLAELNPGLLKGFGSAATAVVVLGLLIALGVAGGALEVVTSSDGRAFGDHFGRGAFRFYGRFLRLGVATAIVAALTAGIVAGPLFVLRNYVRREYGYELLTLAVLAAAVAAGALMLLFALLAQDAARVMIVRDEVRGVVRALRRGTALVWRHPIAWLGTWSINAILLLVAFALYLALAELLAGVALFAVAVLLQQLFVLARCTLRVALLGSEVALVPVAPVVEVTPSQPIESLAVESLAVEVVQPDAASDDPAAGG